MFETVGRLSKLNQRESEATHFTGFCLTFWYLRWIQTVQCVEHIVYFQIIISFIYLFFVEKWETSVFGFGHTTLFFINRCNRHDGNKPKLVFTTDTHVVVVVVVIIGRAPATYRKIGHTKHDVFCEIRISSWRALKWNEYYRFAVTSVRLSEGVASLHGCRIVSKWVPAATRQRAQQPNTKSKC